MSKFIIEKALIEKSEKDIQTGINYEFTDGMNIICGDNEVGKSSLMTFISKGLFRKKEIDSGRIYFKITDNDNTKYYRADIKDTSKTEQKCKLTDENNNSVEYSFIEKNINEKYFEQGFKINLDDLMNIQNKNTSALKEVISDPSGEQIANIINKLENSIKDIIGEKAKPVKDTGKLLDKIIKLSSEINNLKHKETDYNEALTNIQIKSKELENAYKKEAFILLLTKEKEINTKISEINDEIKVLSQKFNENLFKNREKYIEILQKSGKYESNKEISNKYKIKLEEIKTKTQSLLSRLNNEYGISLSIEKIINFNSDDIKLQQIKEFIADIQKLEKSITDDELEKKHINNELINFKHDLIADSNKYVGEEELKKLQELNDFLNTGIEQYYLYSDKINNDNKTQKVSPSEIKIKKVLTWSLIFILISVSIASCMCYLNKIWQVGILSSITAFITLTSLIYIITRYNSNITQIEKTEDEIKRDNILNELKKALEDYYPEINSTDSTYISSKIENIKTDLQHKIQNLLNIKDSIERTQTKINCNQEKLEIAEKNINSKNKKIDELKEEANKLISSFDSTLILPYTTFPEVYSLIIELKDNIKEENAINTEINATEEQINNIEENLKEFIIQNSIETSISEIFENNITNLKEYNDRNDETKSKLDILNTSKEDLTQKTQDFLNNKTNYSNLNEFEYSQENKLEEIKAEKERIIEEKKAAEFQKKQLESFEGLDTLRTELNVHLEEYKDKIKEFIKNKILITLLGTAKNNFAKIQPDLQNAQKYLSVLTDNKYSIIDLDREEIQDQSGGNSKAWEHLSRGTKEQLYLALRLGYASNYAKDKISLESNGRADLPIIIDDAFVNFDEKRMLNALKCLIEFSKTNQVLFFTCHTDLIKNQLKMLGISENKDIKIINM